MQSLPFSDFLPSSGSCAIGSEAELIGAPEILRTRLQVAIADKKNPGTVKKNRFFSGVGEGSK